MQIPVLIEPIENQGYRVSGGPGLEFVAQGTTPDQALAGLRAEIERRIAAGAILTNLEVGPTAGNPWIACAGSLENDPTYDEWQREIAAYRREIDESPEGP